jgi:pimeloyl-ACP methyl ester carboxylesterase
LTTGSLPSSALRVGTPDGGWLSALDEGDGPAILVVHPGGGDASSWDGVARLLVDEFRVVRVRRRLSAPDAPTTLPHTMALEVADVLAVLRRRLADLAALLPRVERIVTLPGQGHIAHLTAPDLLADVIRTAARQWQ